MRILARTFITTAAALAALVSVSTAATVSYSGNWPVTLTHARAGNGTYCLTLTDNGSLGWEHSGPASLAGQGESFPYGTFQLIDHLLVATIQSESGTGQNAGLVFIAPASDGKLGDGTFDEVYGGEEFVSGALAFGTKGGC